MLHRNSQKRYYLPEAIYFVVIKTFENYPYFEEPIFCDLLVEELILCKKLKGFKLYGFCLIYDHLNLLIKPSDEFNVSKVIQFLKRHFSRNMNHILGFTLEGDIGQCRLQAGDYKNFIEIIKNHEDKIKQFKDQFIQKYGINQNDFPKFKWQKSFRDHTIRNEGDLQNHYNYTVYNFKKHNLPDDWQYTSLNYRELID